jgi:hypothetical protein
MIPSQWVLPTPENSRYWAMGLKASKRENTKADLEPLRKGFRIVSIPREVSLDPAA